MLYVLVLYTSHSTVESGREMKKNQGTFVIYTTILNYRNLPHIMSIANTLKVRIDTGIDPVKLSVKYYQNCFSFIFTSIVWYIYVKGFIGIFHYLVCQSISKTIFDMMNTFKLTPHVDTEYFITATIIMHKTYTIYLLLQTGSFRRKNVLN